MSAADIFALLSAHEPWGVVVNEAAASGLPLVLSDRVGAAADLLRDGENGMLVPYGDVSRGRRRASTARRRSRVAPALRSALARARVGRGATSRRSRAFVEACREAIASR